MYAVILAGGGGTRLWPLSRPEVPKPFLPLLGPRTLLQMTYERLVGHQELGLGISDVHVVTDRRYEALVAKQLPGVGILAEPIGRNTAPAIALATIAVERPDDEVMLVLPADHAVEKPWILRGVLAASAEIAWKEAFDIPAPLMTIGIQVDRPATEYGYLLPIVERGEEIRGQQCYPLAAFEEKPTADRAIQLRSTAGVAWNAGIFAWRRQAIRDALERYTSLITLFEPVVGRGALEAAYDRLRPVSIDVAVMESAARDGRVVMTAMEAGWSDLGSWTALLAALGARGSGRVVQAGERADAEEGDLVIESSDGRLTLHDGPRGILGASPAALLSGAGESRALIEALLERVERQEVRP